MAEAPIFIDVADTEDPDSLPPPPVTPEVIPPGSHQGMGAELRYGHLLPHGTTMSGEWDEDWVRLVVDAERIAGYAICGARRRARDLTDDDQLASDPLVLVCKRRAGYQTDHSGEGRCAAHGGNVALGTQTTGAFSMLKHSRLSPRVQEFFENEELMDMRSAISTIWASMDVMLEEQDTISPERAQEIGTLMTRVGNLIKQHSDIQEKRRISIGVPEFMAWAEFFYELAVRYLEEADGDVTGFLKEAQQFYDRTVTIVVGAEARRDRVGAGDEVSPVEDAGVPRPALENAGGASSED